MAVRAADSFSAFAGLVDFRNHESLQARCRQLLPCGDAQLLARGPVSLGWVAGTQRWSGSGAGFGSASHDALTIIGDFRLDNRCELARALSAESGRSDCQLALASWSRWGANCLDQLRGDYAFALWSADRQELELVRGPYSTGQIFYRSGTGWLAFAPTAQALAGFSALQRSLDRDSVARFIGGIPQPGTATFFADVRRLEHSHILRFSGDQPKLNRFWRPIRSEARRQPDQELADEFRELFDRAVGARITRDDGSVAAHLSSGRDSGAIVGAAATILARSSNPLFALTSAPHRGFAGSGLTDKLDDESMIAAATAALYPNVRHCVVRSTREAFADVSKAHALRPNPLADLPNYQWGRKILELAAAAGASVLLSGDVGNFTLSGGGQSHLSLVLREQGFLRWLERARSLVSRPLDLLKVINWTFGSRIPLWAHRYVRGFAGLATPSPQGLRMLREPFRSSCANIVEQEIGNHRPPPDPFAYRAEILEGHDPANLVGRALWKIDGRDPTADRDLVEFCFGLPAHLLVGPEGGRPLYELAFGDRLDPRQLRPIKRGYQAADWDWVFTPEIVATRLRQSRRHPDVREVIDLDYADRLLASWPRRWPDLGTMLHYRNDLLGVVAAADFIAVNF